MSTQRNVVNTSYATHKVAYSIIFLELHQIVTSPIAHTIHGTLFSGGKFWWTAQVNAIGEENVANKLQSVHMPNTFQCICEYWQGKFWRIAHNSPNSPISPYQNFPTHSNDKHDLIVTSTGMDIHCERLLSP